jgi:hypothetical protein
MVLRRVRRHVEHRLRRRRNVAIASRLILPDADRYRLHQRRRHRQRAGDIVEARVESSGGRNLVRRLRAPEDRESRWRTRAIEAMKARSGQMRDRGAIELASMPEINDVHGRRIRTARSSWRHQARPQLSDDLFSHLRVSPTCARSKSSSTRFRS